MTEDKGILIKNIYYMLTYAFQELRKNNYEDIAVERFDDIYDLFAEILSRGVSYQLKQGLHRNYVEREDELITLRGKLNLASTICIYSRGVKRLACEYDEYSENNVFNQILKTTLKLLVCHKSVKTQRKVALRKLLPFFSDVDTIDLRCIKWSALRFDRNSKTYQMLLYLCYFIIDNNLLSTESGNVRMNAFTDERMCRLFEKFVLEYYKKHHPELNACPKQITWNIVERETTMLTLPILQTDIYLSSGDRTLIIDTKYYSKSMQVYHDKHTIHSGNLYQILTYVLNHDCHHTGRTDGMLLYAKTQEEIQPDGQLKWHNGNTIYYRTLDLNQDFKVIENQLEEIINLTFHEGDENES